MKHYLFVDWATQGYAALVGLLILCFHNQTVPHWPWLLGAHVTCLLAVHWLIQMHARHRGKALDFLRHFYPVLLYTGFYSETGRLNRMFFRDYMDPSLIRWEQALFGSQPSLWLMDKFPFLPLSELFYAAYFSYYVMILGVGVALFLRQREQFYHYVSVISFVFYVCYLLYIVLPVIGPPVLYGESPGYRLPAEVQALAVAHEYPEAVTVGLFYRVVTWIYRVFEAPGAAFPSSHVAVALSTAYFSWKYLPRIRYVHALVVLLLCLSTVYCRYHYATDVLAGALTAALLLPLGNWLYRRFLPSRKSSLAEVRPA